MVDINRKHKLVPDMIADQPAERIAIVAGGQALTYGELCKRAADVTEALSCGGIGPDDIVAICVPPSVELIIALYGVLRSGAAYLPMDPNQPDERLHYQLTDSNARAVLVTAATADRFAQANAVRHRIDDLPESISDEHPTVHPGDLAYVIYTSGSTGQPKGVAITHGAMRGIVDSWTALVGLRADDRGSQVAALGFDATILEIWPVLAAGAALHLADEQIRADPPSTLDFLCRQRITVAFLPTPLAEAVLRLSMPDGLELRVVGTGGDRLRIAPEPRHPFTLINAYGPTESTVVATATEVPVNHPGPPPIGYPVNGAEIEILDPALMAVPDGVVGELHIGGDCLARGYLGRPDLTADHFRPHPVRPGARLYRTGDLVSRHANGTIHFVGRGDDQVKIRGHRIELGEIEACLLSHGGVAAAAVAVHRTGNGDPALVGYLVAAPGVSLQTIEVENYLSARLPAAMIPRMWAFPGSIPLSANGKVDRAALAVPSFDEPTDEFFGVLETYLASVWADLLGRPPGRHDNFFACGGHSLLATQIAGRVRMSLEIPTLPLNALFQAQTVAELAELVTRCGTSPEQVDEMAGVQLTIDSLSAEEIAELLAEQPEVPTV